MVGARCTQRGLPAVYCMYGLCFALAVLVRVSIEQQTGQLQADDEPMLPVELDIGYKVLVVYTSYIMHFACYKGQSLYFSWDPKP